MEHTCSQVRGSSCAWRAWSPSSSRGGRRRTQGWWLAAAGCRSKDCCCWCSPEGSSRPRLQSRTDQRATRWGPDPPAPTGRASWELFYKYAGYQSARETRESFVSLSWGQWLIFPYEPGVLRDHIGDAIDDGVGDAELLVDQLVGVRIVPGKGGRDKHATWSLKSSSDTMGDWEKKYFTTDSWCLQSNRKQKNSFRISLTSHIIFHWCIKHGRHHSFAFLKVYLGAGLKKHLELRSLIEPTDVK